MAINEIGWAAMSDEIKAAAERMRRAGPACYPHHLSSGYRSVPDGVYRDMLTLLRYAISHPYGELKPLGWEQRPHSCNERRVAALFKPIGGAE